MGDEAPQTPSEAAPETASTAPPETVSEAAPETTTAESTAQPPDIEKKPSVRVVDTPGGEAPPPPPEEKRGSKVRTSGTASKEGILRRRSDRPSKAGQAVGSVISIGRAASGFGASITGTKAPRYMNSYKLDSDKPFHVETVQKILEDVLTQSLDGLLYDPDRCPKQAKWAVSAIRARVKEQEYDRYKLVILVTIGEKRYHDMCCMARFLWDIDRDKYAVATHENMYVFSAAMCFGVYFE